MKWFRVYHDMPHDPKLRRIAHQAGTTLPHTLAVWLCMLSHASANEGEARGTLRGWSDDDCAFALGMDRAVVYAIRREMEGRILDGERIPAWIRRQAKSDNTTARWRAWNERRREGKQEVISEPTLDQRGVNVGPTSKKRREEKREERTPPKAPPRGGGVSVDLPSWLPAEAWADWCAYRKDRTWTQRAAELSIGTLSTLRDAGHDPARVINQSIANGWRGLFPVKSATGPPASKLSWIMDDPIFGGPNATAPDDDRGLGALPAPVARRRA